MKVMQAGKVMAARFETDGKKTVEGFDISDAYPQYLQDVERDYTPKTIVFIVRGIDGKIHRDFYILIASLLAFGFACYVGGYIDGA